MNEESLFSYVMTRGLLFQIIHFLIYIFYLNFIYLFSFINHTILKWRRIYWSSLLLLSLEKNLWLKGRLNWFGFRLSPYWTSLFWALFSISNLVIFYDKLLMSLVISSILFYVDFVPEVDGPTSLFFFFSPSWCCDLAVSLFVVIKFYSTYKDSSYMFARVVYLLSLNSQEKSASKSLA